MRKYLLLATTAILWLIAVTVGCLLRVARFAHTPRLDNYETQPGFQVIAFFFSEFWLISLPFALFAGLIVTYYIPGKPGLIDDTAECSGSRNG